MTKKFTINCDFGGQLSPFTIYVGQPQKGHHALHFQADWLSKARGGMIPGEVMEAVTQLQELAEKNGVALEDLCVYALGTDKQQAELEGQSTDDLEVSDQAEISEDEEQEPVEEQEEESNEDLQASDQAETSEDEEQDNDKK
jgi:hypothetical protein